MEPEMSNKSDTEESCVDGNESFSRVSTVAAGWMLDFMFVRLCRNFKDGKLEEFSDTLNSVEAICESPHLNAGFSEEKKMICAFLARVMHGKQLDVLFDEDDCVMPLMSAAVMWPNLKDTVADESLFNNITVLLRAQAVAVCLQNGQRSSASSALKWFEDKGDFPQNLRVKLTTIVKQRETYHPFLMSFSFNRLLDTVQSFLDAYLKKNPSDYLLKAARKVVQSEISEGLEEVEIQDSCLSDTEDEQKKKPAISLRTKRKLLSTKITDLWTPETCKKSFVSVNRISKRELSKMRSENTSMVQKPRKRPRKWTPQLDKYLINGVKCHGEGKWSRILLDYDFEGRTGVMLKDRWRVLRRSDQID